MLRVIDVGKEFYHRLANRDHNQGDGKHTAVEFRARYLSELDKSTFWENPTPSIAFDFSNVKKIGPSFANEAFAYYTKYAKPERVLVAIEIRNATEVQMAIIQEELESGYNRR
jgi:hypothetical protein